MVSTFLLFFNQLCEVFSNFHYHSILALVLTLEPLPSGTSSDDAERAGFSITALVVDPRTIRLGESPTVGHATFSGPVSAPYR